MVLAGTHSHHPFLMFVSSSSISIKAWLCLEDNPNKTFSRRERAAVRFKRIGLRA